MDIIEHQRLVELLRVYVSPTTQYLYSEADARAAVDALSDAWHKQETNIRELKEENREMRAALLEAEWQPTGNPHDDFMVCSQFCGARMYGSPVLNPDVAPDPPHAFDCIYAYIKSTST